MPYPGTTGRRLLATLSLALSAGVAAADTARPLLPPQCASSIENIRPQFPDMTPGQYYLIVRHHGDPDTDEWLGQVANPVSWDVGHYSGFRPPEPVTDWQRGFYDEGPPIGSSAVQWHCSEVGFLLNTYQFRHTRPIIGGGPNIAYEQRFDPLPPVWRKPGDRLRLELDLKLPWVYAVQFDAGLSRGVGQVSLFYYARHLVTGRIFAHVLGLFDTRPFGVGNGSEFLGHDTYFDFASSPVAATTRDGVAPRYAELVPGSAEFRNASGWDEPLHFAVEIGHEHIQRVIDDLAAAGQPADDAADFAISSVGVLIEALPSFNDDADDSNDHNVSFGGSFSNMTVSTIDADDVFDDGFE